MKVYLVNISLTAGGVLPDIMRVVTEGRSPRKINEGAMKIYLAEGGMIGTLRKFWRIFAEIGDYGKAIEEFLKKKENEGLPLRGHGGEKPEKNKRRSNENLSCGGNGKESIMKEMKDNDKALGELNILESYYYLRNNPEFMELARHFGSFMLDSGAFSFIQGSHKGRIDWDAYIEEYAAFIRRWDVELFFELDIDSIVGLPEVERLRAKLEGLTGRKCIPVWHGPRGKDYFLWMCDNYDYVGLGGIAIKEIPLKKFERALPWFIKEAHARGCRIHGLGYTTIAGMKKYHFDSVDSTAWLYGNRGGFLYQFIPATGEMKQIKTGEGQRLKSRESAVHNFNEWVKFGQYAEKYL